MSADGSARHLRSLHGCKPRLTHSKPHLSKNYDLLLEAAHADGFDIRLRSQPPSSHDMNVLYFGFFNAIQSLQHAPKTVDD